jgi:Domain of unknown function (DUF6460)
MVLRFATTGLKILIASLLVGYVLSSLNITAEQVLNDVGVTPEKIFLWLQKSMKWALPNIMLGSIIIVPVWIVIYLFRPPRS